MRGNITRRGKSSWRIRIEKGRDPVSGKRQNHYVTIRGRRQDAERELTRLLSAHENGGLVEPSKVTIGELLRSWLDSDTSLSPKTRERYTQLAEQQIIPHLGSIAVQKLKPAQVQDWHGKLLKAGGKNGSPLSARTTGHAHRVLHRALELAVKAERVSRNVAHAISPPKVTAKEIETLSAGQMAGVLAKLDGHPLLPLIAMALGTGMRRGEILALRWTDLDLDASLVRVERSLEETKAGLRFKSPKTKHGRRLVSLPASVIDKLKVHRRKQLEDRLAFGLGKPNADALVFANYDGTPMSPDNLSRDWRMLTGSLGLPRVMFHALRHTHASALIASRLDVLTISRRLGHASPVITLGVYGHLFTNTDTAAADIIEAAMRTGVEQ